MRRIKWNAEKSPGVTLPELSAFAILLMGCFSIPCIAQQRGQKTFSSPDQASAALFAAMQSNDEKAHARCSRIRTQRQIVSSGDETEDACSRANFVEKYREMHRLVNEPDGTTTLYTGAVGTGQRPYRWCTKATRGISTPRRPRRKFCTGELAGTNCRPSACAKSS